jgi:hypothetical protein
MSGSIGLISNASGEIGIESLQEFQEDSLFASSVSIDDS